MTDILKRYIFASDFDQTLTFNDSGYVLAELVGIPTEEFERKSRGMAKINLVQQGAGPDHVVYTGDGSSDIHVMLHINARDGLTIAVSESPNVSQIARRTVLSTSALAVLAPILEEIAGWERYRIRSFFEANHMLIQEWERVRTDWLTVRPAAQFTPEEGVKTEAKLESART